MKHTSSNSGPWAASHKGHQIMDGQFSRRAFLPGLGLLIWVQMASAALNIPSDGSDGQLVVTANTTIDLGKAVTGDWDDNNSANPGKGIYDSNKWAVVFKYSSVAISSGATVTFANHPSRAPVVWLVNGDVTIDGVVSLDGQAAVGAPGLAEPGPGGFRGGTANFLNLAESAGFGPGGGQLRQYDWNWWNSGGGSFGGPGNYGPAPYGNPSLLPLIGGSGGGGKQQIWNQGGGGGGGAIQIVSSGSLTIAGTLRANGGPGNAGGSGGGIRLIADTLNGSGVVQCSGGGGWTDGRGFGGLGRVRIERVTNLGNPQVTPDPSIVRLEPGASPLIWLPQDGPTVRIVSIGSSNAPVDPRASFGTFGADIALPQVSTTAVVVETVNAEDASIVTVRVSPRADGHYSEVAATLTATNSTNPLVLRWLANVPVNRGYSAVQVKVVRP